MDIVIKEPSALPIENSEVILDLLEQIEERFGILKRVKLEELGAQSIGRSRHRNQDRRKSHCSRGSRRGRSCRN